MYSLINNHKKNIAGTHRSAKLLLNRLRLPRDRSLHLLVRLPVRTADDLRGFLIGNLVKPAVHS